MGLWNTGIDFGWMCFTHPYYNKVGTRKVEGRPDDWRAKRKPANHVGCTQWAGRDLNFPFPQQRFPEQSLLQQSLF